MESNGAQELVEIARELAKAVGDNLWSCCVYGSYARGNAVVGVSDINLLIVLRDSKPNAHAAIAEVLGRFPTVDPLIVAHESFARTARCFAPKFASIRHHYRVLHGQDPFEGVEVDSSLEKLLCEQALRNVRMRATYAYVMNGRGRRYGQFLLEAVAPLFVQLSDVLRLSGQPFERDFKARIPRMTQSWGVDGKTLEDLHALRANPKLLVESEAGDWHRRLLAVIDPVLGWIEANWSGPTATR